MTRNTIDDFWKRVDKTNTCWIWTGKLSPYGYFGYKGKGWIVHRFAWVLTHGDIPKDLCVLHRCDNPACVRPEHLFLGTYKDNSQDMVKKGRSARGNNSPAILHKEKLKRGDEHWARKYPERVKKGDKHHKSKLSENLVREIRNRFEDGESIKTIANEFELHFSTIWLVVKHRTWRHVR